MGFINDGRAGTEFSSATAEQRETLGAIFTGSNGIYQYAKATEAISAGEWVGIDENGEAELMDTTLSGSVFWQIGVAVSDAAENEYAYFWRGCGTAEALLANGHSAGAALTTTATAGTAGSGGDAISGAYAVDAGVTNTLVTVHAVWLMTTNA